MTLPHLRPLPQRELRALGSIAGTVTVGGKGVHMASVVAIQTGLDAVSTVTIPTVRSRWMAFRQGIRHLRPYDAARCRYFRAVELRRHGRAPSGAINTVFYSSSNPGTTTFSLATRWRLWRARFKRYQYQRGIPRVRSLYDGQIYGYFNNNSIVVTPAPVTISTNETPVVASIVGLGTAEPANKLTVQLPGGSASIPSNGIVPYTVPGYAALYLNFNANSQPGQQHIIFNTPDYTTCCLRRCITPSPRLRLSIRFRIMAMAL